MAKKLISEGIIHKVVDKKRGGKLPKSKTFKRMLKNFEELNKIIKENEEK